jgi:branched-subunit amino acid ABC-type transport system permease component
VTLALQLLVNGVVGGALLALVALGLAVIFGVMRVINFAHGEFITLGAYLTWLLAGRLGLNPLIGVPLSFIAGAALGWLVQALVVRRVATRPALDMLMVTYALSALALGLFSIVFGGDFRSYSAGPSGDLKLWGVSIGFRSLTVLAVCALLTAAVLALLRSGRLGLALRAVAENRDAAASSGIDVNQTESIAFSLAVGLAAAAGSLVSLIGATTPGVGHDWVLDAFVVVVVGGLGSVTGALVAAIGIGLLQSFSGFALDDGWAKIITYVLLYAALLLRPQGLFGQRAEA